jgi:Amidase
MNFKRILKRFVAILCMFFIYQWLVQLGARLRSLWGRKMPPARAFDPLRVSALDLQNLLDRGHITTTSVIETYLAQIEAHNHNGLKLHCMITTASKESLVKQATTLDRERKAGKIRSPLHGIPIIVKVSKRTRPLNLYADL